MPFFNEYAPIPALRGLIRSYKIYHVKWDEEKDLTPPFITCLANTEQNLYLLPRDPMSVVPAERVHIPAPAAIITGPKTKPVGLMFGKDHLMIKVEFQPTGIHRLFGFNMKAVVDKGLEASTIVGDEIEGVLGKLRRVTAYEEMAEIASAFMYEKYTERCKASEPIDQAATEMLDAVNEHSLTEWADKACLSMRQFERNFGQRVGMGPKLFIRIRRFELAMQLKNDSQRTWSEIAMECNYADSSHLLKEFKRFAEFPPSKFYLNPTSGHSSLATA
ncbi:MAG: AraC family transcriptional regulator [Chryseolinea sp.]